LKIFDFNVHLPVIDAADASLRINDETALDAAGLLAAYRHHAGALSGLSGINFMLFNQQLFDGPVDLTAFVGEVKKTIENVSLTALLNFRSPDLAGIFDNLSAQKVKFVKFHSYVQKITQADAALASKAALMAQERNMGICIDTSYGTTSMYRHDNLSLACEVADLVDKVPIILLHSGGARLMEAMLIALSRPNVFLETSFSIPFYEGTSIAMDAAFAYKKTGAEKIIYASDFPYVSQEASLAAHHKFFDQHGFSNAEIEKIMFGNAINLISD
jgi:predicted TIM-barrel fold metal-dependent hydrolase